MMSSRQMRLVDIPPQTLKQYVTDRLRDFQVRQAARDSRRKVKAMGAQRRKGRKV
jgi:hypothetical protein